MPSNMLDLINVHQLHELGLAFLVNNSGFDSVEEELEVLHVWTAEILLGRIEIS